MSFTLFLQKKVLPVDPCPQKSTTRVTLISLFKKYTPWTKAAFLAARLRKYWHSALILEQRLKGWKYCPVNGQGLDRFLDSFNTYYHSRIHTLNKSCIFGSITFEQILAFSLDLGRKATEKVENIAQWLGRIKVAIFMAFAGQVIKGFDINMNEILKNSKVV